MGLTAGLLSAIPQTNRQTLLIRRALDGVTRSIYHQDISQILTTNNKEEEVINQNEFPVNSPNPPNSFTITESMLRSLRQTKPWARLLSILGFISIGFMVINGVISMIAFSKLGPDKSPALPMGLIGSAGNLLLGLLYFFPSLFLFKYASSIGRLLDGGGASEMEKTLSNQKSFWKFVGILTIITIVLALIGIVAAITIPQIAHFMGK